MRAVTTKVDVFSFGVVVLELLTGHRPTALTQEDGHPVSLHQLAERALAEGTIHQILDPALASDISTKQTEMIEQLVKLACLCTSSNPADRPDMSTVVSVLLKIKASE